MSYALTDAGEDDMRAELKALESLNDSIDQLASEARDCSTLAPEVADALNLAWYYTEAAMREAGTSSCGHVITSEDLLRSDVKRNYCVCCDHFRKLRAKAEHIRRML